jgi:hypothetical protein
MDASNYEESYKRRKRQAETDEVDPEMQEVQSIWSEMWENLVHGAKKIVKFEREAEQQQYDPDEH